MTLQDDIQSAINRNSAENGSNTPDWLLAEYLTLCLKAFDGAVAAREKWYGRDAGIGPAGLPTDGRTVALGDPIGSTKTALYALITLEQRLRQTVARGYCDDQNAHKELDSVLLNSIVHEIILALDPDCHPSRRLPLLPGVLALDRG